VDVGLGCSVGVVKFFVTDECWYDKSVYECHGEVSEVM
jgi:hypothetical protein